ncbi:hypothetical protein CLV33_106157 [Jejuia pallidilutea]|jgi:hypothetical protein|uniref:Right handed beta helix domain-containing protein n=1 Tax=Jejuia pallidilutea TaxID=504487 RepID=A0A362XBD4_9FLAO|nr:hypothetical protein [Jejuia pallidilutea]PQV47838.1 hypothetical protein CLV33_106157 [Jejuia pallidilutea]
MKTKLSLLICVILITTTNYAQKVVALHSSTNGVQYFNENAAFQEAYDASVAGDTIYLPGGTHTPPNVFNKKLTIFGAGHHPDATIATFTTKISGNVILGENADGFHLEGVHITSELIIGNTNDISINDITIKRCRWTNLRVPGTQDMSTSNNNVFVENIFNSVYDCRNLRSSSFFNNIISNHAYYEIWDLYFVNNVFTHSDTYGTVTPTFNANNCVFQNNIFLQEGNNVVVGSDNTFENNIFCNTISALGTDPTEVNSYYMTRSEVLVNQTGNVFEYTDNYHLQAGAATNLGTDATETGIYGGVYPWKDYSIPTNPHISSKSISGSSDTNGNIQIDINVHAQTN